MTRPLSPSRLAPLALLLVCGPAAANDPATPAPTVWHAHELAKVMDFTKLPTLPGTVTDPTGGPAHLQAKVPGTRVEVAKFYLTALTAGGWKPARESGDDATSATLWKDGHSLYLMTLPAGDTAVTVILGFKGNFDTRTLPRAAGAADGYGDSTHSGYFTDAKVPAVAAELTTAFTAAGWQAFGTPHTSTTQSDTSRHLQFRKHGYDLTVTVGVAPARGGRTSVQCGVVALSHELPAPPEATNVEFADFRFEMRCQVPLDLAAVTAFYQKAMPAAGYTEKPSDPATTTHAGLRYGNAADDNLTVALDSPDGKTTRVTARGTSAAMLAAMRKLDAEQQESKGPAEPTGPRPFARSLPLPKTATAVEYDEAKGRLTFEDAAGVAELAKQLREQWTAAGWTEKGKSATTGRTAAVLRFTQGAATVQVQLVNTPLTRGTRVTVAGVGLDWGTPPK